MKYGYTSNQYQTCENINTFKAKNEPGLKFDSTKNRLGLVLCGFAKALQAVGEVGTFGTKKYGDNNWMVVENGISRYTDALFRHLLQEADGEEKDIESNLLHDIHAAWNCLSRLELMLRKREPVVGI